MENRNLDPVPRNLMDVQSGYASIVLKDMYVEVRIGAYSWEKPPAPPQQLVVNVELFVHAGDYLFGSESKDIEDIKDIVDYSRVRNVVKAWEDRPHTMLIETYMRELVDLCFEDKRVMTCRVSILKPNIFSEAAGAGVEVYMSRSDYKKANSGAG